MADKKLELFQARLADVQQWLDRCEQCLAQDDVTDQQQYYSKLKVCHACLLGYTVYSKSLYSSYLYFCCW